MLSALTLTLVTYETRFGRLQCFFILEKNLLAAPGQVYNTPEYPNKPVIFGLCVSFQGDDAEAYV